MADHKHWVSMKPKLHRAFAALKKVGIRAEMNFSISLSNGIAEIYDADARGYAFYHSQDQAGAKATGEVSIAFGSFAKRRRKATFVAIGREVRDALVAAGLHVVWDETAESRPTVYASTKVFEAQHHAEEIAEQDEARAEAEYERVLPAWLAAVDASDFHDRLRVAAESMENCFWVSHHNYGKAEKRHDARTKKLGKVRIGLPLENKFIHPNGWVVVSFDNTDVYKNKHVEKDLAAACRKQGLVVAEVNDGTRSYRSVWLDLSEWKPEVAVAKAKQNGTTLKATSKSEASKATSKSKASKATSKSKASKATSKSEASKATSRSKASKATRKSKAPKQRR